MEASKTCPIISSPHSTPAGPSQLSAAPPVPNHNEATTEAASLAVEPIASLLNSVVAEVQLRWRRIGGGLVLQGVWTCCNGMASEVNRSSLYYSYVPHGGDLLAVMERQGRPSPSVSMTPCPARCSPAHLLRRPSLTFNRPSPILSVAGQASALESRQVSPRAQARGTDRGTRAVWQLAIAHSTTTWSTADLGQMGGTEDRQPWLAGGSGDARTVRPQGRPVLPPGDEGGGFWEPRRRGGLREPTAVWCIRGSSLQEPTAVWWIRGSKGRWG
jgi:hypothetical protein